MSPRTGRPKIENPMRNNVKVRLDDATNEAILKYAKKNGITRVEAIRRAIHLLLAQDK